MDTYTLRTISRHKTSRYSGSKLNLVSRSTPTSIISFVTSISSATGLFTRVRRQHVYLRYVKYIIRKYFPETWATKAESTSQLGLGARTPGENSQARSNMNDALTVNVGKGTGETDGWPSCTAESQRLPTTALDYTID
jgi:hypothetical protein